MSEHDAQAIMMAGVLGCVILGGVVALVVAWIDERATKRSRRSRRYTRRR